MKTLTLIYEKLNQHYGYQKWWPAENFLEMAIGAILIQNTQWRQVEKSLANLRTIDPSFKLKSIPIETLVSLIAPSGYALRKSETILSFLAWYESYGESVDILKALDTHSLRQSLLAIHGIGFETADAILLYGLDKPKFIMETYCIF